MSGARRQKVKGTARMRTRRAKGKVVGRFLEMERKFGTTAPPLQSKTMFARWRKANRPCHCAGAGARASLGHHPFPVAKGARSRPSDAANTGVEVAVNDAFSN